MSIRLQNFALLVAFIVLSSITSTQMWILFRWLMIPHMLLILIVAGIGENLVSSQGYYHYAKNDTNGPFLRRMPVWILFLWVFSVQASLLIPLSFGLDGMSAIIASGLIASSVDFYFIEPFMSGRKGLWLWKSVENGYFRFIPRDMNRFTAPAGNYLTWLIFPICVNLFLALLVIHF
ncbi:MAG: hypothetical protein ACFFCP_13245 [Promethearchaeota archaeon]